MTNSTDTIITIGKNAAFFSGQEQIFPMEPMEIKQSIKQIVPGYLPFMFLTLITLNVYKGNSASSYPIGFVLGPMITAANMTMAGKANKNMLTELYEFNILNKDILAGETVFGLIGVRDMDFAPLTVKMKN